MPQHCRINKTWDRSHSRVKGQGEQTKNTTWDINNGAIEKRGLYFDFKMRYIMPIG